MLHFLLMVSEMNDQPLYGRRCLKAIF